MPPQLLFDINGIDLTRIECDQEGIRRSNPQRGDMEQLNGIIYTDGPTGRVLGFKDIRLDEFWVPGHIPGRPLYPGVLMIEAGAQLAGFYTRNFCGWHGFIGFGGVDKVKFRTQVVPPCRMYLLAQKVWERHHRIQCDVQGVVNGTVCFEAAITGTQM
jgi:3-hydroxyacyl-[acyl-carrier-protein] dehydratase